MVDAVRGAGAGGREPSRLPARAAVAVIAVPVAAAGLIATGTAGVDVPGLVVAGLLVLAGVVHTELAAGIERRRRGTDPAGADLSSVWTFAAAVLLVPALIGAVVVLVHLHLWQRVWRRAGMAPHRYLYTTAAVVLAGCAAHTLVASVGMPAGGTGPARVAVLAGAALVYLVVDALLVAGVIVLAGGGPVRSALGGWDENAVEVAAVCLGALAALALRAEPVLVVLALPPILVLHRAVLVRELEEAAATDAKTGLLTVTAWQAAAEQALARARRHRTGAAVLILDLDHFKIVNDAHGHLAGDGVLAAVAAQLRAGVRQGDLVGRFGGEEFLVLLPDLPAGVSGRTELCAVAERLRGLVAALRVPIGEEGRGDTAVDTVISGLSVSIGGATAPLDGTELDQLLRAADASLYAAKRDGRNQVRIAALAAVPPPRRPLL